MYKLKEEHLKTRQSLTDSIERSNSGNHSARGALIGAILGVPVNFYLSFFGPKTTGNLLVDFIRNEFFLGVPTNTFIAFQVDQFLSRKNKS